MYTCEACVNKMQEEVLIMTKGKNANTYDIAKKLSRRIVN